jgi:tRNA A-37 threonylcarbamoyl transferase component Bud32
MGSSEHETDDRDSDTLITGNELGHYVLLHEIGSGVSGTVFEALDRVLERRVAVKVLSAERSAQPDMVRRFLREGRAAAKLDNPHIVKVLDVGTSADGAAYLVMELLQGETLESLLRRVRRLSAQEAADLLIPVISGVAAAHEAGIVHRDLKPANIFLCQTRHGVVPKVLDFGISKFQGSQSINLTETKVLLGTPNYMAPEQTDSSRGVDPRADQFSLGVILYECVTGRRPFDGDSVYAVIAALVNAEPTPLRELCPEVSPEFAQVVQRALKKQPNDRFATLRSFGRALLPFASPRMRSTHTQDFEAPPVFAFSSAPPPSPARTLWWVATGIGLMVAVVASWETPWVTPASEVRREMAASASSDTGAEPAPLQPIAGRTQARYEVVVSVDPANARVELDGESVGRGRFIGMLPLDGVMHELRASAPGYESVTITFRDEAPPRNLVLEELEPAQAEAPP